MLSFFTNSIFIYLRCAEDLSITAEERIELLKPLRERQDEIEVELSQFQQADKRFEIALDVLLDLAYQGYTLFESSQNLTSFAHGADLLKHYELISQVFYSLAVL